MADDRLCFSPVLFEFNNHWAEWARGRGLMTYSGKECAPESASLLTAYRQRDARQLGRLQHGDGYPCLDLSSPLAGDALRWPPDARLGNPFGDSGLDPRRRPTMMARCLDNGLSAGHLLWFS